MEREIWKVVKRTKDGKFVAVISGLGRNKGTWDSGHSKATAQRYAAKLRKEDPSHNYVAEDSGITEQHRVGGQAQD